MDDVPNNYWYKNLLALAISQQTQKVYLNKLPNQLSPYISRLWSEYFHILRGLWNDQAKVRIEQFIADSTTIAFLVANDTPNEFKNAIRKQFAQKNRQIRFRSLKDLTTQKGVQEQKIIVLQYRYTDLKYKSYPNSFDRLPLKPSQKALVVINKLTHYTYFEWGKYRYYKSYNGLLYSDFRKRHLGWENITFNKPSVIDINEYIDESEANERNYHADKCRVYYKDGRPKEYLACERVLYLHNGLQRITALKDLSSEENIKLQLLDELTEQVKLLITEKTKNNSVLEEIIRKDCKYSLSDAEIHSNVELWKILLRRKVTRLGEDDVYAQIFSTLNDADKVSKGSFSNWCDPNNTMMLPRSRKCQIALLRYLGFEAGSPYYKVIISKKLTSINKSRSLNSQIDSLLQKILLVDIDDELYKTMCDTYEDIFTLLDVDGLESLRSLKDLLDISLNDVTKIECEDDDTE
ncbi:MAG: hypothetical protein R3Y59_09980 [bacterium]